MKNLMVPEAVADALRVSVVSLHHWRKRGVGPEWLRRSQYYYYPAEKFEAYLERIGLLPETDDPNVRRRFFMDAHRTELVPDSVPMCAELAKRLTKVERALAKLKADTPKRRKAAKRRVFPREMLMTAKVLGKLTKDVRPTK